MNKKRRFHQHLLSAAFAALPGVALAADLPASSQESNTAGTLRSVTEDTSLRAVPGFEQPAGAIVQIQFEQASTTPGNQKVLHADGRRPDSLTIQLSPETGMPELVQTQYAQPQLSRREQRRMAQQSAQHGGQQMGQTMAPQAGTEPARPGLFKRLFGRFRGDSADGNSTQIQPGEPAPPIPKPPAIVYESAANRAGGNAGKVPTRMASFGQQKMSTPPSIPGVEGLWQEEQAASKIPNLVLGVPVESELQPTVTATQVSQSNGFVDPFAAPPVAVQDDVLLDLDSLLEKETVANRAVGRTAETAVASTSDSQDLPVEGRTTVTAETATNAEQPFTGYTINPDEALLTPEQVQQATSASDDSDFESVPLLTDESSDLKNSVVQKPQAVVTSEADSAEPVFEDVPGLTDSVTPQRDAASTESPAQPSVQVSQSKTEKPTQNPAPAAGSIGYISRARREHQRFLITSRAGQTGFKGFCPVELRNSRDLVDVRKEYSAKFGLQTYYFSSPQAKAAFEANPAKYAPAAGGSDVVLLVNTSEEAEGSLEFSLWYHDRLYMFRSRETQQLFSQDPARYADQY